MDTFSLSASAMASAAYLAGNFPLFATTITMRRNLEKNFIVSASSKREEPKLNEWDQMELRFGRLLGEDLRLTLSKVKRFFKALFYKVV
ncbi:unnamed protein product [Cochlearia groenlandica]